MSESSGHKKLKKKAKTIFERCGFTVDTEVKLDLNNDGIDDHSFDVCALCSENRERYIIVVQCKDTRKVSGINTSISSWGQNRRTILQNRRSINVVSSDSGRITTRSFRNILDVKLVYAFTSRLQDQSAQTVKRLLSRSSIVFWDSQDVKYYDKVTSAIGTSSRYEIYREFGAFKGMQAPIHVEAVEINQRRFPKMYLMGLSPGVLIRMGYVLRRTSNKSRAYQRAINKDRISSIREFFSSSRVLLPNSIIIAFDNDPVVQNGITYNRTSGLLTFSPKFCSAWIIDGQHRVYGFAGSGYDNSVSNVSNNFKLPVVAFKSLSELLQNKTFVNINYYQKKIDPTLFCDLSTEIKDLKNELTWPSLLGVELNKSLPWRDIIRISEYDTQKSITLSSFARYALLEFLLGYNKKLKKYSGSLYRDVPFDISSDFESPKNKAAFKKQVQMLKRFSLSVHKNIAVNNPTKDIWRDYKNYSATKPTGVNALLLVLCRILEKYPNLQINNLDNYLEPVGKVNFSSAEVSRFGGGWKGFRSFANHIIKKLNKHNNDSLKLFHKKRRKR